MSFGRYLSIHCKYIFLEPSIVLHKDDKKVRTVQFFVNLMRLNVDNIFSVSRVLASYVACHFRINLYACGNTYSHKHVKAINLSRKYECQFALKVTF